MYFPQKGDYIDIHVHDGIPVTGNFILETIMAHENKVPEPIAGVAYTFGIHPWFIGEDNTEGLLLSVENAATNDRIIAIGELGFDRLHGPSPEIQSKVFEEQILISERTGKPAVIHCVKAWDELLRAYNKMKPKMPWLIHGFRGNEKLADQLIAKGMFLSFWFEFILRPKAGDLLRHLPKDRIFLETDGADIDIRAIYSKVAKDLFISVDELKSIILNNFEKWLRG